MRDPKKRQQFINLTYDILRSEGAAGVSIRRIAKEIGCTSTLIYNYFDNLEHLIALASIRFLEDYIQDYKRLSQEKIDPLELNLRLWECLMIYALKNVDAFEMLFFGKYKDNLSDIIYEYYEIFSMEFQELDGLIVSVLFSNDLKERDHIMFRRASTMGYIDSEMVDIFTKIDTYAFHGILLEYKNQKLTPEEIQEKAQEFAHVLRTLVSRFRKK